MVTFVFLFTWIMNVVLQNFFSVQAACNSFLFHLFIPPNLTQLAE